MSTEKSPSKKQRKAEEEEGPRPYLSLSKRIAANVAKDLQMRKTEPEPEEVIALAAFYMFQRVGRVAYPVEMAEEQPHDSRVVAQKEVCLGSLGEDWVFLANCGPIPRTGCVEIGIHLALQLIDAALGHDNKKIQKGAPTLLACCKVSVEKFERTYDDDDNNYFTEKGWIAKWYA